MKTNIVKLILALAVVLALQTMAVAAERTIDVKATVPSLSGLLDVTIYAIDPTIDYKGLEIKWPTRESIDFGLLERDEGNFFKALVYYAVDVGVLDNTGRNWILAYTATSIGRKPAVLPISRLDDNIVVTFEKMMQSLNPVTGLMEDKGAPLGIGPYAGFKSNQQFNRGQLAGGWLRIYYGLATGLGDPVGAVPVPLSQLAGDYSGSVTITLTPQ